MGSNGRGSRGRPHPCHPGVGPGARRPRWDRRRCPHHARDSRPHGLVVRERVPIVTAATRDNVRYLAAKRKRMGHLMSAEA